MNVSTDKTKKYFVVGSAVEESTEDEPKEGYIRVYEVIELGGRRKLNRHTEFKVNGSVYCVEECDGKLVCGIGSKVLSLLCQGVILVGSICIDTRFFVTISRTSRSDSRIDGVDSSSIHTSRGSHEISHFIPS